MYKVLLIFPFFPGIIILMTHFLFRYKPLKNKILWWLSGGKYVFKLTASGVLAKPCKQFLYFNGQELRLAWKEFYLCMYESMHLGIYIRACVWPYLFT